MNKGVVIGITAMAVVVGIIAGAFLGPQIPFVAGLTGDSSAAPAAGPNGFGGPMGNLSEEERAQLQSMTDEERQAFMQEKFGDDVRAGAQGGRGPGDRVVLVEGEVVDASDESLTVKTTEGGSRVVYLDGATAIGYPSGSDKTAVSTGDEVVIVASPEADNVDTAKAMVIK